MYRVAFVMLTWVNTAQADISFVVEETVSGNQALVSRSHTFRQQLFVKGNQSAVVEGDFVHLVDRDTGQMVMIDHQERKRAHIQSERIRQMQREATEAMSPGIRIQVVEAGVPDKWNELAVLRNITTILMPAKETGLPSDAEATVTEWTSTALPGWAEVMAMLKGPDERRQMELKALVSTMAVSDVPMHQDILAAREKLDRFALPVRALSEIRLLPAPGEVLMRIERQLSRLSAEAIPQEQFLVPREYEEMDYREMLKAKVARTGH